MNEHVLYLFFFCLMSNQWAGVPSVDNLISIYCRCRGIPSALPQLNFYLALSVFKMAGIAQVCTHTYTRFYWNCITVCFIYFYLLMSNDGLAGLGQIILNVIMLSLPVQLQYLITLTLTLLITFFVIWSLNPDYMASVPTQTMLINTVFLITEGPM